MDKEKFNTEIQEICNVIQSALKYADEKNSENKEKQDFKNAEEKIKKLSETSGLSIRKIFLLYIRKELFNRKIIRGPIELNLITLKT
jgi:hypothetical protein